MSSKSAQRSTGYINSMLHPKYEIFNTNGQPCIYQICICRFADINQIKDEEKPADIYICLPVQYSNMRNWEMCIIRLCQRISWTILSYTGHHCTKRSMASICNASSFACRNQTVKLWTTISPHTSVHISLQHANRLGTIATWSLSCSLGGKRNNACSGFRWKMANPHKTDQ